MVPSRLVVERRFAVILVVGAELAIVARRNIVRRNILIVMIQGMGNGTVACVCCTYRDLNYTRCMAVCYQVDYIRVTLLRGVQHG